MGRIHRLPTHIADQIAAGEVVERPASVVRELLENAIDAGATAIDIEIEDGGKRLIRVTDNGCGMDRDDLELAVERHATSKIRTEKDLEAIMTFGFRGEAIPSIASVSRFAITSRPENADTGWRVRINFGRDKITEPAGCPAGTIVEVEDLFLKIPARLRFLKRRQTEAGHISQQVRMLAVAHPEIRFSLKAEGREVFRTPGKEAMPQALWPLVGRELVSKLLPVEGEMQSIKLQGFVAPPDEGRSSSKAFYFFLNGRNISNRMLWKALNEASKGFFMSRSYPVGALFLEIDPSLVDVNVHPAKQEVRFHQTDAVYRIIYHSLRNTWEKNDREENPSSAFAQKAHFANTGNTRESESEPASQQVPLPWETPERSGNPASLDSSGQIGESPSQTYCFSREKTVQTDQTSETKTCKGHIHSPFPGEHETPSPEQALLRKNKTEDGRELRLIGQLDNSYILCQGEYGLVIIDQHAAHEGIIFKRLKEEFEKNGAITSQPLLFPEVLDVRPEDAARIPSLLPILRKMGIEAEEFGPEQIQVRTMPDFLAESRRATRVLREIIDRLLDAATPDANSLMHDILSSMACHSAIRANQTLSPQEMQALLDQLGEEGVTRCPHGRPVSQTIDFTEIRRNFKRTGV